MRVAVLMSTYNGEKYIREQIDSILSQQGKVEVNLWVRDDGSQDCTQAILQEYANSGKLHWYAGENIGPSLSFIHLLKQCGNYDYYAFADQDDFWMPDKILHAVQSLQANPKVWLYTCNAELVDSALASLGRNVYKTKPVTDFFSLTCAGGLLGCTMVFCSELATLVRECPLPKKLVLHDFYLSVLCVAMGAQIMYDDGIHLKYRQHGNNVVGVSKSVFQTIKGRLKDITQKSKVSIAEQSEQILTLYDSKLLEERRIWLRCVANYRETLTSRILLATTGKTKYMNRNMSLKLRLSILFGNR